jgi:hypothetical protein
MNGRYNLLHFHDIDWDEVKDNHTLTRPYALTKPISEILHHRLWDRYTTMPHTRYRMLSA